MLDRLDEVGASVGNEIRKNFGWVSSYGIPSVVADYLAADTEKLPWKSLGLGVSQVVLETKR